MVAGQLRAVVCTGSLDLGLDWGDVDLVIQVGAPKNVKRLVQRIGRANHRYNAPSKALILPANRWRSSNATPRSRRCSPMILTETRAPRSIGCTLPTHPDHRLRGPLRRRRLVQRSDGALVPIIP